MTKVTIQQYQISLSIMLIPNDP